jgi:hypothetical protein
MLEHIFVVYIMCKPDLTLPHVICPNTPPLPHDIPTLLLVSDIVNLSWVQAKGECRPRDIAKVLLGFGGSVV